jgi:hypothetical protein
MSFPENRRLHFAEVRAERQQPESHDAGHPEFSNSSIFLSHQLQIRQTSPDRLNQVH